VKALTKVKKKEFILTDLELVNLNNVSLLNSKKFRERTVEAEKEKLVEEMGIRGIYSSFRHNWKLHRSRKRVWTQLVSRKG
jgi:hypothetical protein